MLILRLGTLPTGLWFHQLDVSLKLLATVSNTHRFWSGSPKSTTLFTNFVAALSERRIWKALCTTWLP